MFDVSDAGKDFLFCFTWKVHDVTSQHYNMLLFWNFISEVFILSKPCKKFDVQFVLKQIYLLTRWKKGILRELLFLIIIFKGVMKKIQFLVSAFCRGVCLILNINSRLF